MPLPQQDEFGDAERRLKEDDIVSMPLPQQDEFGDIINYEAENISEMSQCRFRSKMNSE